MIIMYPIIKPLPIKTKNKPLLKKIWIWLTITRQWILVEDFYIRIPGSFKKIFIPKGFIFDGVSIPRIFWTILNPIGILFLGAIPHDFGYKYEGLFYKANNIFYFKKHTRKELDQIFYKINEENNKLKLITKISLYILRLFGWIAWNNHRKENKSWK